MCFYVYIFTFSYQEIQMIQFSCEQCTVQYEIVHIINITYDYSLLVLLQQLYFLDNPQKLLCQGTQSIHHQL